MLFELQSTIIKLEGYHFRYFKCNVRQGIETKSFDFL